MSNDVIYIRGVSYSTSSTRDLILAFPPLGTAKTVLQERQRTFVDAFPKIVWLSLHFEHCNRTNFPFITDT